MLVPIRCFSCGKPISHLYKEYSAKVQKEKPIKLFQELEIQRQCCRALFLGINDMTSTIARYRKR